MPDLDQAIAFHTEVLGLRLLHREDNLDQQVAEAMLVAGPADAAVTQVQLLAPLPGGAGRPISPVQRFLDRRGPGLHHLAYRVVRCRVRIRSSGSDRGLRLLYDAPRAGTRGSLINFVHPKDTGGVLIELVQRRPELIKTWLRGDGQSLRHAGRSDHGSGEVSAVSSTDNTGLGLFDDTASAVGNFPTALRGYDRTAVDDYVRTLEASVVQSRRHAHPSWSSRSTALQDQVASTGEGGDGHDVDYSNLGGRANDILRLAQEQARELVENATIEAEKLKEAARREADGLRSNAAREGDAIKSGGVAEIDQLRSKLHADVQAQVDKSKAEAEALIAAARRQAESRTP